MQWEVESGDAIIDDDYESSTTARIYTDAKIVAVFGGYNLTVENGVESEDYGAIRPGRTFEILAEPYIEGGRSLKSEL